MLVPPKIVDFAAFEIFAHYIQVLTVHNEDGTVDFMIPATMIAARF